MTRPGVLVAFALFAAGLANVAAAAAPLSKLVLRGPQVGAGYTLKFRPDSHGVTNTVTLDMCGTTFRSEALRTARLQVDYSKRGSPLEVSNEVVTYRARAAQLAMREIRDSVAHCPTKPVTSAIAGVGKLTYRVKRLENAHGLLPGAIDLLLHISGTANGHHIAVTQAVIYQCRGNVLSGIYGSGGPVQQQARLVVHAAAQSAKNLRQ